MYAYIIISYADVSKNEVPVFQPLSEFLVDMTGAVPEPVPFDVVLNQTPLGPAALSAALCVACPP